MRVVLGEQQLEFGAVAATTAILVDELQSLSSTSLSSIRRLKSRSHAMGSPTQPPREGKVRPRSSSRNRSENPCNTVLFITVYRVELVRSSTSFEGTNRTVPAHVIEVTATVAAASVSGLTAG